MGPYRDTVGAGEDGIVTVPFIKRPDGTYLRDSLAIMRWLDVEYRDRPSIVVPGNLSPYGYAMAYDAIECVPRFPA